MHKTSTGSDGIPYWVFKECAGELCVIISVLINFSINEGCVPSVWKHAVITPASKVQPVTNVSDLRPISVTPVFARITERLIMRDFFLPVIPNECLRDQFAYTITGSTTSALVYLTTAETETKTHLFKPT